jgi:pyridinium-3,5-bisthiocarboxylic acid mononucleotide nickel chelatase
MKILYFDCFNGASGDMILGALLDAGVPLESLREALGSLAIDGYTIAADRVLRAGVSATKFRVINGEAGAAARPHVHHHHAHEVPTGHSHDHGHAHDDQAAPKQPKRHHPHRSLPEIFTLIDRSALAPTGKDRAKALFERLAVAEAAIHQMPVEKVHLHEVGALDSIIDIVGAVYALDAIGASRVVVSPINVGRGMVQSAHGVFPVPAPATVRLLADTPIFSRGPEAELLTPTGALLLTAYAQEFGPLPAMRVASTGYGAGDHEFADTPNVLRILVGESADGPAHGDRVLVVESEIDDMNPQLFGSVMDQLYAAGALEVFFVPVQMKKSRPGTLVSVLVAPARKDAIVDVLFRETTTIGVRFAEWQRECLAREIVAVETPYGDVRIKVARRNGVVMNGQPEFDDCAARARQHGVATKDVHAAAMKAWIEHRS